jgi:hypothetical protein
VGSLGYGPAASYTAIGLMVFSEYLSFVSYLSVIRLCCYMMAFVQPLAATLALL